MVESTKLWLPQKPRIDTAFPGHALVDSLHARCGVDGGTFQVRLCAIGLLEDRKGNVTLFRRSRGKELYPKKFCAMGGHLNKGEPSLHGIRREGPEELGILPAIRDHCGVVYDVLFEQRIILVVYRYRLRYADTTVSDIRLNGEHDAIFHGSPAEAARTLPLVSFTRDFLEEMHY